MTTQQRLYSLYMSAIKQNWDNIDNISNVYTEKQNIFIKYENGIKLPYA